MFTTKEVLTDNADFKGYIDNPPSRIVKDKPIEITSMKGTLKRLLRREWPKISGGRDEGAIFWCEVDRRDIRTTYKRVIEVIVALSSVGRQGKEIWVIT